MRNSAKGVLAAGAAVALLVGGGGTLAFWTAETTISNEFVKSGTMSLSSMTCTEWELEGVAFDEDSKFIVPGDTLNKTCSGLLTASGEHLTAELGLPAAAWLESNGLTDELNVTATYTVDGQSKTDTNTVTSDEAGPVVVELAVEFPYGVEDNESQTLTATLADLVIDATQLHVAP